METIYEFYNAQGMTRHFRPEAMQIRCIFKGWAGNGAPMFLIDGETWFLA